MLTFSDNAAQLRWEKLYWFLKFLIPKLIVKDPQQDQLDELLNSVDLSTYGLERVRLNEAIALEDEDSEVDPQNPNMRGYRGDEPQQDPLDQIISAFNDRFFSGWDATPDEQRVKILSIARYVRDNPKYKEQVENNPDEQNRKIAFKELIKQAMIQRRKQDLELYRLYASDADFERTFDAGVINLFSSLTPDQLDDLLSA
jgi:type I restriction enzyme R subunit